MIYLRFAVFAAALMGAVLYVTPAQAGGLDVAQAINEHRQSIGLPAIKRSRALEQVAQQHSQQQHDGRAVNHSWADCDFAADPSCMWLAPQRLGTGYGGLAYEISCSAGAETLCIRLWLRSAAHRDVIEERASWGDAGWNALGCATVGSHTNCWFGEVEDTTPDSSGLYFDPDDAGQGVDLRYTSDGVQGIWYTYNEAGEAVWYTLDAKREDDAYRGGLYEWESDSGEAGIATHAVPSLVGTVTIVARSDGSVEYSYAFPENSGELALRAFEVLP